MQKKDGRTLITPEIALDLLTRNTNNRKLNPTRVAVLAALMIAGKFIFNGETIKIDRNGRMLDGQHRLHAIIKSGIPQYMIIVEDLDPECWITIDTGRSRSLADVFQHEGIQDPKNIAAAIKLMVAFGLKTSNVKNNKQSVRIQYQDALDYYHANQELIDKLSSFVNSLQPITKGIIGPSVLIAIMYHVIKQDETAEGYIYDFIKDLLEESRSRASNMPELLREQLVNAKAQKLRLNRTKTNRELLYCIKYYKHNEVQEELEVPNEDLFKIPNYLG